MIQAPKSHDKYSKFLIKNATNTGTASKASHLLQTNSIEAGSARFQMSNQKFQNMFSSQKKAPWTPRAGTFDELSDQGQAGLQLRARPESLHAMTMRTPPNKLEQFLQTQELKRKQYGQLSESFQKNQWQFQRKTPSRMKKDPNQSHMGRQQSGIYIGQRMELSDGRRTARKSPHSYLIPGGPSHSNASSAL